jgi:hypothetical protein
MKINSIAVSSSDFENQGKDFNREPSEIHDTKEMTCIGNVARVEQASRLSQPTSGRMASGETPAATGGTPVPPRALFLMQFIRLRVLKDNFYFLV